MVSDEMKRGGSSLCRERLISFLCRLFAKKIIFNKNTVRLTVLHLWIKHGCLNTLTQGVPYIIK